MSKKKNHTKPKINLHIGKPAVKKESERKSDFYHKHKSTVWTIIILIILAIFFIKNNSRETAEQGPYPPNYNQGNSAK